MTFHHEFSLHLNYFARNRCTLCHEFNLHCWIKWSVYVISHQNDTFHHDFTLHVWLDRDVFDIISHQTGVLFIMNWVILFLHHYSTKRCTFHHGLSLHYTFQHPSTVLFSRVRQMAWNATKQQQQQKIQAFSLKVKTVSLFLEMAEVYFFPACKDFGGNVQWLIPCLHFFV